jgi:hypothetical protein
MTVAQLVKKLHAFYQNQKAHHRADKIINQYFPNKKFSNSRNRLSFKRFHPHILE